MQQSIRKCKCGNKTGALCTTCSKIRMAVMLKNGYKNNGLRTTYYCFLNDNPKPDEEIFKAMERRIIEQPQYANAINKILFFNNISKSNTPIKTLSKC